MEQGNAEEIIGSSSEAEGSKADSHLIQHLGQTGLLLVGRYDKGDMPAYDSIKLEIEAECGTRWCTHFVGCPPSRMDWKGTSSPVLGFTNVFSGNDLRGKG